MGCSHSKGESPRTCRAPEMKISPNTHSNAVASLDKVLPPSEEMKPGSWKVFATEEDRRKFIGALMVVLTDNGKIEVHKNSLELHYSDAGGMQRRVVVVIKLDGIVKSTHVCRQAGASKKEAFQLFHKDVYQDFDKILIGAARNVRPRQQASEAPRLVNAPSHKMSRASLRSQPPLVQTSPAPVNFSMPMPQNKGPLATVNVANCQTIVPASLAPMLGPRTSMMDLLEGRNELHGHNSAYQISQRASHSQQRIRAMSSVPTLRSRQSIAQSQPYMMSGGLSEQDWFEYEQAQVPYAQQHTLSRQPSFATARTHSTHWKPRPSRYASTRRVQHMPSMPSLTSSMPLTPPESPGQMIYANNIRAPAPLRSSTLRLSRAVRREVRGRRPGFELSGRKEQQLYCYDVQRRYEICWDD